MKRMLFNAQHPEELRVAIVDGQKLVDLDIETSAGSERKGNIYKSVVTRVEPSLEACFVDYGAGRHGFLPLKEISRQYFLQGGELTEPGRIRIQDAVREGQRLLVQVEKEERGSKGAALTTYISLAGRYLVLMPNNPRGGGVSRRIEGEERDEMRDALSQLELPAGMSVIGRTAGVGHTFEEMQWDLNYLMQLWQAILEAADTQDTPFLIYQESSLVIRAIRDYFQPDIGEILIDDTGVYEQAAEFMRRVIPQSVGIVRLYRDEIPLFSRFQVERQIETALSRLVPLSSGGSLVFDHTEALMSVDVNSARATSGGDIEETALKTNLEAAEEVARQLRLRDIGGLVVVDFIDMEAPRHMRDVENRMRDAMKYDRARVQIGRISRFGLLELSRQRLGRTLGESSTQPCPRCGGTGQVRSVPSMSLHVLRMIEEEAIKPHVGAVHAQLPVDVSTFLLNEKRQEIEKLERRAGSRVVIIPNPHLHTPHHRISALRQEDLGKPEHGRASFDLIDEESPDQAPVPSGKPAQAAAVRIVPAVRTEKAIEVSPEHLEAHLSLWKKVFSFFKPKAAEEKKAPLEKPALAALPAPSEEIDEIKSKPSGERRRPTRRPRTRDGQRRRPRREGVPPNGAMGAKEDAAGPAAPKGQEAPLIQVETRHSVEQEGGQGQMKGGE